MKWRSVHVICGVIVEAAFTLTSEGRIAELSPVGLILRETEIANERLCNMIADRDSGVETNTFFDGTRIEDAAASFAEPFSEI